MRIIPSWRVFIAIVWCQHLSPVAGAMVAQFFVDGKTIFDSSPNRV
jgi:hypothetical protein